MAKHEYIPRFMETAIREELKSNPAVVLVGPRQAGKTTLVQKFIDDGYAYFSLKEANALKAVDNDFKGLLRSNPRLIIDEHQMRDLSQGLFSVIDERRQKLGEGANGMIILTGSFTQRGFDSLIGRTAEIRLLPLAQAELRQCRSPSFLQHAFAGKCPRAAEDEFDEAGFIDALLKGGYPLLLHKQNQRAKAAWLRQYLQRIRELDLPSLKPYKADLPNRDLLAILARYVGGTISKTRVCEDLGISKPTLERILGVLEALQLIKLLGPLGQFKAGNRKLHFVDSSLYAQMAKLTASKIARSRHLLGPLLENFVFTEIAKHCDWANEGHELSYFRQIKPSKAEVDLVIEDHEGRLVGIEVKAGVEPGEEDFRGLRAMKESHGDDMVLGMVLCLGRSMMINSQLNFHIVNVSALWGDYPFEKSQAEEI